MNDDDDDGGGCSECGEKIWGKVYRRPRPPDEPEPEGAREAILDRLGPQRWVCAKCCQNLLRRRLIRPVPNP